MLGVMDLVVWLLVNLICILIGFFELALAKSKATAQVDEYISDLCAAPAPEVYAFPTAASCPTG